MTQEVQLRVDELKKLQELCETLKANSVTVVYEEGGGIGYFLYGDFETEINNVKGTLRVEISGVEDW